MTDSAQASPSNPLHRNGSISYLHLPATDVQQAARFYESALGWSVSDIDSSRPRFDDGSGYVSGAWMTDQTVAREPGVLLYIYVDHIDVTVEKILAHGGEIVRPVYLEGRTLWVATFRDPAGNQLGLWHEGERQGPALNAGARAAGNKPTIDEPDLGELERHEELALLRFTRHLAQPPEAVWLALTEDESLTAWFPTTIEGDREPGAPLRFNFRDMDIPSFAGEMLAFDPPSLLELCWGEDILRFQLRPEGDSTVLSLTVTMAEFGKAARDGAGWHSKLDLLAAHLAGQQPPWSQADRWRALHRAYVERFGPEASTIGPPQEWDTMHGTEGQEHP